MMAQHKGKKSRKGGHKLPENLGSIVPAVLGSILKHYSMAFLTLPG